MVIGIIKLIFYLLDGLIFRRIRFSYLRNFSRSRHELDLSGKTILITGAASGFGRQFALDFLAFGARAPKKLILWDLSPLDEFQKNSGWASTTAIDTCQLDTTDYQKVSSEIEKYSKSGDNVDICVCNAGIAARTTFRNLSFEKFKKTIDINFMSKVFLTKQVMDTFSVERMVYTASVAGYVPGPNMTEYSPSKHAIRCFAESLEKECKFQGAKTKFSVICPYFAPTGITTGAKENGVRMDQWKKIPFKITIDDVSQALMDCIHYDLSTVIVGRFGVVIKWIYYLMGPQYNDPSNMEKVSMSEKKE